MYLLFLIIAAWATVWYATRNRGHKTSKPPKRVFDKDGYDQNGYDRDGYWKYGYNSDYMKKHPNGD